MTIAARMGAPLARGLGAARTLLRELTQTHDERSVEAALDRLRVLREGDAVLVTNEDAGEAPLAPLFGALEPARALTSARAKLVRIAANVYLRVPTADARVRVLRQAATLAPHVHVHAPNVSDATHRGRVAIDAPRRALRALGLTSAEPGDRFGGRFSHAFFDDEALIDEGKRAGLSFVGRRNAWALFERDEPPRTNERPAPFRVELWRALALVRRAESIRRRTPPERAVETMRERGRLTSARGYIGRARLRRAIGWVDAAFPGGPNCLRRALVELGLDAGAAEETLVFGLDVGQTGHVAFKGSEARSFDVAFEIPAPRSRQSPSNVEKRPLDPVQSPEKK